MEDLTDNNSTENINKSDLQDDPGQVGGSEEVTTTAASGASEVKQAAGIVG